MKALVFHGPGNRSYEEKPMPIIKDAYRYHCQDQDNHLRRYEIIENLKGFCIVKRNHPNSPLGDG